jgi:hypothetical protein
MIPIEEDGSPLSRGKTPVIFNGFHQIIVTAPYRYENDKMGHMDLLENNSPI